MHYFQVKVDMLLQQISKVQIYLTIMEFRITCSNMFPFQRLLNIQTEKRPSFLVMLKPLVRVSLLLPPLWGFLWKMFISQGTAPDSEEGPRGAANQRQSANDRPLGRCGSISSDLVILQHEYNCHEVHRTQQHILGNVTLGKWRVYNLNCQIKVFP